MITKKAVSVTEEKRIVVGLIVSTKFCQTIKPIFKLDYFVNSYLRTIASWCDDFFESYKKAPNKHIKDIFTDEVNARRLDETETELIEKLLTDLDNQYGEEEINFDYWVEMAEEYFRSREIEITINNISILKEKGDLEEAEKELLNFQKISFPIEDNILINPGNLETQEEVYRKRDEEEFNFFQVPGDLGKYLGNQKRGDVVGYFGPAKRGKCVGENSLIYLSDGTIKTIKEVVNKKLNNILCVDENKKIIKGKVVDWLYCGLKQEYMLLTKGGRSIKTSKDHKFYTPEGWKSLYELKKDDLVAMAKNTKIVNKSNIPIHELKMMAYLIADGYLGKTGIQFTKHNLEIMNDFISCVYLFKDTCHPQGDTTVHVHKNNISDLLVKTKLDGKRAGDKFIPDYILQARDKDLSIFLRTLFTCDGSIWKDRNCIQIDYSSKSYLLINQVLFCLNRFNIYGKVLTKKVNNILYYEIILSSNSNIIKFMNKIGFTFNKQEKALDLCGGLKAIRDYIDVIPHKYVKEVGDKKGCFGNETFRLAYKRNKNLSRYTFQLVAGKEHKALNNDLLWDKVKNIKRGKIVPMYDLTIEKNHNYISDGFIVHNSHILINQFKHGVLKKRKTLFFSIEMTATEVLPKINQAFFPTTKEEGIYKFPVFDCVHNKKGDCVDRLSHVSLVFDDNEQTHLYDPNHEPCTLCKNHPNYDIRTKYKWDVWKSEIYRNKDDVFTLRKEYPKFQKMWDRYGRLSVHKKYSLTYDKMMYDIDYLWQKQSWFPDILIIDYIDILQINSKFDDYRLDDEKWKLLAKIAGETNTLVITATQANKEGHQTDNLDSTHQGGFYGKNRHVNLMVGLNQKKGDKEKGIMRFGITEARSLEFYPGKQCIVLQDFQSGQAYLDSYLP